MSHLAANPAAVPPLSRCAALWRSASFKHLPQGGLPLQSWNSVG